MRDKANMTSLKTLPTSDPTVDRSGLNRKKIKVSSSLLCVAVTGP